MLAGLPQVTCRVFKRRSTYRGSSMTFKIRYLCGEFEIGEAEFAGSLEEARRLIEDKVADLDHIAEAAIIFRISPSGAEELEEARKLHS